MTRHPLRALVLGLPALALASCSTMKTVGNATVHGVAKAGDGISHGLAKVETFSVRDLMPARVKVVEVRDEKALKPMPLGHDLALAHQDKHKKRNFWGVFSGREFKEPTLPNQPEELDGTLLPPL